MLDLWPNDIGTAGPVTPPPVVILREQAAALGNKTRNIVEGEVVQGASETPDKFLYAFHIVGPALGGYRYRLLKISHPIEMYPVEVSLEPEILKEVLEELQSKRNANVDREVDNLDPLSLKLSARSEDAFKAVLQAVFNAPKTRSVIKAIIAQSTA